MFQLQLAGIVTEGFFNGIIDQADAESLIIMATSLWIISFSFLLFFASADIHSKFLIPFLRLPFMWKKRFFFFFLMGKNRFLVLLKWKVFIFGTF